ncbi:glycosyltransferase family 4 protein [Winogradskyella vincentii]|uniref:Glycosyltransferase family 4 protein n=1 Tax=Winogradskyella vincentii TaxID=2877122 RepID=A0ABS7XW52_9FLAO|nr:glycosyltransferase family 4 protein [Winogradskyella vincentii]MCA0151876.1 glycosyltransferase family 4 protein [Winogradskyella vincentii]
MSKKVLIVHLGHWDQLQGGAEQQLEYLTKYLISIGNEVHRIFLNVNNKPIKSSEVSHYSITLKQKLSIIGKNWFIYKEEIYGIAKQIDPDLLITRSYTSWAGIVAKFAGQRKKKHLHFIASDIELNFSLKTINWSKPLNLIEHYYYKKVYHFNSKIIVQNEFQKEALSRWYSKNGHKITQACPISDERLIEKDTDGLKIVWIGNFKAIKRPDLFITIADYFSNNCNYKFTMVGGFVEKRYENLLKSHINNLNFEYTGELSNDHVNSILNKSHILINTSFVEGFSNTFLQAWMRKNIVISLNSNPDDILTNNDFGFLTGTVENTVRTLKYVFKNRSSITQLGNNARNYTIQNHSFEKVYSKIYELLNEENNH